MIIQSIPHLQSIVESNFAKIKEAETHIEFWAKNSPEVPEMIDWVKRQFNYKSAVELYQQAKTELEKLKNN